MTLEETTRMRDLLGRTIFADELTAGDPDPRFTLELPEDDDNDGRAVLVFREPLDFHAEFHGDQWPAWTDDHGYLLPAHEDALTARVRARLAETIGGDPIEVTAVDDGSDEPNLTLEFELDYRDGETFDAWFDRIGWPVIATMVNISDPGTFNSPYLFAGMDPAELEAAENAKR